MDDQDFAEMPWPPRHDTVRALLDDVLTDAYGDAEQVTALYTAFADLAELPCRARLAGRPVTFTAVEEREPVLVARCATAGDRWPCPSRTCSLLPGRRPRTSSRRGGCGGPSSRWSRRTQRRSRPATGSGAGWRP